MASPKWAKPDRQNYLALILLDYLEREGWKVDLATGEYYHPDYEVRIRRIIANWSADDRARDNAEWQAERKQLHSLGERRYPVRGQFNNISQDIFFSSQPLYYLEGMGVSGVTLKPFAKVRIASGYVNLYVDIGQSLKGLSKNQRHKAIRYGKPLPPEYRRQVDRACQLAARHYLNH